MILRYFRVTIQFLSLVAISLIIATENISNYWIIIPITSYLISELYDFSIIEKYKRVHAQLQLLYKMRQFKPKDGVRCAYHIPFFKFWLFQNFGYIPFNNGGGRCFQRHKGIIGKSYKDYETFTVNFENINEYRQKMISEFGYTEKEIRKRRDDRRSYLCHPLIDEKHKLHGLIYFDSCTPYLFPSTHDKKVKEMIMFLDFIKDSILSL